MPSIVLRHISDSDQLTRAIEALGYEFERKWSPEDRRSGSRNYGNFGFNLCLANQEDLPVNECLQEALQRVDELESNLSPLGQSLRRCTVDIGIFEDPAYFTRSARLSSDQCARLGNLGVDFDVTFYPSSGPES